MITLLAAELRRVELRARMPFRYGIATMTEVPHVFLRLTFEIDGRTAVGTTADHLPPKWFTKNPTRLPADEIDEMLRVIRAAVGHARGVRAATPAEFARELGLAQKAWATGEKLPPLLASFGSALVEKALLDAFCRVRGVTFSAALRANLLGVELGAAHAALAGSQPADWLPAVPLAQVWARHTVGLSDAIEEADLASADRVDDGLPQSLAACVRFYGLRHFKLKIDGDIPRNRDRLLRIAAVLRRECPDGDYAFSLDGNESFFEVAAFADHARALLAEPALREFWARLRFIEQPLHRDAALGDAADWSRVWPERPPIIIDESDGDAAALPRALALGYAGTSHKNCKGVFKGLANACLLAQRRAAGLSGLLTGEDLTNIGPLALLQDLAVQAAFGVESVERNGHHYFTGLSFFPRVLQEQMLAQHGDLYTRHPSGWPRVDVRAGRLALGTVNAAPFGCAPEIALGEFTLVAGV